MSSASDNKEKDKSTTPATKSPQEPEKVKEIPVNKYSIYEIKSAIDSRVVEVNKISAFINQLIIFYFTKAKEPIY